MSQRSTKYIKKSEKFEGVYLYSGGSQELYYMAQISVNGHKLQKHFNTEIEAAKSVDMFLIKNNKQPKNILKKKQ